MIVSTRTSCAVLVPHDTEYEPVRRTLKRVLGIMDVQAIDVGASLPGSGKPLHETILQGIVKADLIIADITGGNPNVMYEVGFAHALKKPVLLIVRNGEYAIPSDLRGELFFVYEPERIAEDKNLEFAVRTWVERYAFTSQNR